MDRRALRPQGRKVIADAAALLQRQRRLAELREDAGHIVGHGAHNETIEEGDVAIAARTRLDAPGGQESEILERFVKPLGPGLNGHLAAAAALRLGQGLCDAAPAILDRILKGRARIVL